MPDQSPPDDILLTIWVVKLSSNTKTDDLLVGFSKFAPVRKAHVTKINDNYVGLLEFESFEGKRLILDMAKQGRKFDLPDGSQVNVRDSRTSIRLFLQAEQPQDQQLVENQMQAIPHWNVNELFLEEGNMQAGNSRYRTNAPLEQRLNRDIDYDSDKEQAIDIDAINQSQFSLNNNDGASPQKLPVEANVFPQDSNLSLQDLNSAVSDTADDAHLPLIEDHQVAQLIDSLSATIFSSKKFSLVKDISERYHFTCSQVGQILGQFRISFEQKQLLTEYLYRRIRDPENIEIILKSFEFSMDQEIVRKILEMLEAK